MIEEFKALFRFEGRRSRRGYWRAYLWGTALGSGVWLVGCWTMIHIRWLGVAVLSAMLPVFVLQVAVIVQRLHDRGRSAFWAAPLLLLSIVGAMMSSQQAGSIIVNLLLGILVLWGAVEVAFLRGKPGANRYGPDPHETRTGYLRAGG